MFLDEYLNRNNLFTHISKINKEYEKKMQYMAKYFKKYIASFDSKKPKGGMFIYGSFKIDSMVLAKEARFNFTNASYKEIKNGIKKLSLIVDKFK